MDADDGPDMSISNHTPLKVAGTSKPPEDPSLHKTTPAWMAGQQSTRASQNSIEETQQATEYLQHTIEGTQQLVDDMPIEEVPDEDDVNLEDITFFGDGEGYQQVVNDFNTSPVKFRSSPPRPGSSSSHSSISAAPEPLTDPPVPSSEADEIQWEASLQPHQRNLNEVLIRTSKRVMRHIVNNETSVTDIVEMYAKDGDHLLNTLIQRHDTDHTQVFEEMENTKTNLRGELERAAKQMAKDRKRFSTIA